ncbi:MAG: hypothetical protein Q9175_000134 [Cornicularia normoerica]
MSCTVPEPCKVRALRIPADGSPIHLITLETLVVEPEQEQNPGSYRTLLLHLQGEDVRHVPNLLVFWGARGWKRRVHFQTECVFEERQDLDGLYYIFSTLESDGLQLNQYLSNPTEELHGDAFVLGAVGWDLRDDADLDEVMDSMKEIRDKHLYPTYVDVHEEILKSGVVDAIARDLRRKAGGSTESVVQMDADDEVSCSSQFSLTWSVETDSTARIVRVILHLSPTIRYVLLQRMG